MTCTVDTPVNRKRPLPVGQLRGEFVIAENIICQTKTALVSVALSGIRDGGHEGLVFWAGRQEGDFTIFVTAVVPHTEHSHSRVLVYEQAVASASRAARKKGLCLLCQVHSHPGADARHSDGDDDLIFMPFDGMLSIVIPNYGIDFSSINDAKVHQYQERRWVLCTPESVTAGLYVAPPLLDVR